MLKREISEKLISWKNQKKKKALCIIGARQIGKTTIIREFAKEQYEHFVEINFILDKGAEKIFEGKLDANTIIENLTAFKMQKLEPGKTLIFLDEIQECPNARCAIKFLVEDQRYRYILSGSLLGVEIVNLKSAPVGYLKTLQMYPLDFEEFLQLFQISDAVFEALRGAYQNETPVDPIIHKKMLQLFHLYLIIGGMPAAVDTYRRTENIDMVMDQHLAILQQYKLDFTQYETENKKLLLTSIYELIPAEKTDPRSALDNPLFPSELNEQNKRFKLANIDKKLRFEKMSDSFTWLWKTGVALPVFNVTEPKMPLLLNQKSTLFKLFLSDVGMLTTIYGKSVKLKIINQEKDINKGAIYENVAAQELIAHGCRCYYYNNKKQGELDFVVEHDGAVLPIEIKSGKDYKKHSALVQVLQNENYHLTRAIVFSNSNVEREGKVTYLPIYMLMFLKESDVNFTDISIDKFKLTI